MRGVHRAAATIGTIAAVAMIAAPAIALARPASSGFFAEGGLSGVGFLGSAKDDSAVGPGLDIRVGHDIFSWFSLAVFVAASSHEATTPPPPTGQYYQLYRGGGDARLGGLVGPIALFVEGGVGGAMISSNVLEQVGITKPGQHFSPVFYGGAGLEYQLENRHYAIGLAGDYMVMSSFASEQAVDARLYLRYTY